MMSLQTKRSAMLFVLINKRSAVHFFAESLLSTIFLFFGLCFSFETPRGRLKCCCGQSLRSAQ